MLVDAGLSVRELTRRLALIGETPERLDAILITHEHSDHIAGLARLARRFQIPVYVSRFTAPSLDWEDCAPKLELFQAGGTITIGEIEIHSFTIPHDAADPVGFCFLVQGIKIGLVTDLGYITDSIKFHLRGTHVLLLESNHDLEMLKVGPYPWAVKQRVMGRNGHLSNERVCDFLLRDLDRSTVNLILGHLSEHNNHPERVRVPAAQALEQRALSTTLTIAEQKVPSPVFQF